MARRHSRGVPRGAAVSAVALWSCRTWLWACVRGSKSDDCAVWRVLVCCSRSLTLPSPSTRRHGRLSLVMLMKVRNGCNCACVVLLAAAAWHFLRTVAVSCWLHRSHAVGVGGCRHCQWLCRAAEVQPNDDPRTAHPVGRVRRPPGPCRRGATCADGHRGVLSVCPSVFARELCSVSAGRTGCVGTGHLLSAVVARTPLLDWIVSFS